LACYSRGGIRLYLLLVHRDEIPERKKRPFSCLFSKGDFFGGGEKKGRRNGLLMGNVTSSTSKELKKTFPTKGGGRLNLRGEKENRHCIGNRKREANKKLSCSTAPCHQEKKIVHEHALSERGGNCEREGRGARPPCLEKKKQQASF